MPQKITHMHGRTNNMQCYKPMPKSMEEFYSACNCVLSNSHCTNELIQLQLQESYCLPILTNAFPGLRANASQVRELSVCWNSVYRKIFHYNRWESV